MWVAILEVVRRALPIVADVFKGNGADAGPAVRRIEGRVDTLVDRYDVQERYLAELFDAVAAIEKRLADDETT